MAEIPEHLLKRSQEARAKAEAAKGGGATPEPAAEAPAAEAPAAEAPAAAATAADAAASGIPAHLLERSRAAREKKAGGDEGGAVATATATAEKPAAAAAPKAPAAAKSAAPAAAASAAPARTQRLLAVVKAGSIQQTKNDPVDKVNTWPHLLVAEFVSLCVISIGLIIFSIFVNAPLQGQANPNLTPNPSKAPWYFLGLQELLTLYHPMVAGVTIPGIGIFILICAPYMDRNPATKPSERKFAIAIFTFFMIYWAVLVILGSFFRGPGFNFTWPWYDGIFFDF